MTKESDKILPDVPEEMIVDMKAYRQWVKAMKNPILHSKKLVHCKEDGREYNLGRLRHVLSKDIEHLSADEQKRIWNLKKLYDKALNNANVHKRKAFGSNGGSLLHKASKMKEAGMKLKLKPLRHKEADLVEMYGKMYSTKEIHEHCVTEWGMPVSIELLRSFKRFHSETIAQRQREYRSSYSDIRLGVKRSRLEELCWLYNEARKLFKENRTQKWMKEMRDALEQIRKEVEGEKVVFDGNMNIDVNATVHMQIQRQALKGIGLRQIILGRAAWKMGRDPKFLISELQRSYYSGKVGLAAEFDDEDAETKFPSQEHYDFEMITRQADNEQRRAKIERATSEATREEKSAEIAKLGVKEQILRLAQARVKQVQDKRDQIASD